MLNVLGARFQQKKRTIAFPKKEPTLPDRFRGRPEIQRSALPFGLPDLRRCMPDRCHSLRLRRNDTRSGPMPVLRGVRCGVSAQSDPPHDSITASP